MKLQANTYEGLVWGLTQFDGIETDMRLTKDNKLAIHHDPALPTGEYIADLTLEEIETRGIPSLEKFFGIKEVVELSKSRKFFLELKPNCQGTKRINQPIADTFYKAFDEVISASSVNLDAINILTFDKTLMQPFISKYRCFPILPDVNECNSQWIFLKAIPQVLFKSLSSSIKEAADKGWAGVFFAREYIMGWTSWFHPSYQKMVDLAEKHDLLLGSNLGSPDVEPDYPYFAKFSDKLSQYPRHANPGDGPIIAHRGTGTKGVEIRDEDAPVVTFR